MPIEEDFTEALRTTLQGVEPPNVRSLAQGGIRSGKRRRRHRAIAVGVSGAAVLALVGAGAAVVSVQSSGGRSAGHTLTDPADSSTASAAAGQTAASPTFTGTLPAVKALATLTSLLPDGLAHSSPPGGLLSGQLWVDDGHGKSLLEVHVSRQTSTTDIRSHVFAGTTPLADGTLVKTRQTPSGTSLGHQVVNVLHPDGLYVTLMEWQGPNQNAHSTRTTPILTLAQLRAIATSAQWQ
jgi:hypothetical protein